MLQFNRNISLVSSTLRRCFGELMSFTLVFFMIWISFVQLIFSVYGNHLLSYSSFVKSMESAFLIMLGKANAYDFLRVYPVLGPLIYSSYNVVILCFALNLFLSIITDSFGELRREAKSKPNEFDLINHLILKMKGLLSKNSKQEKLMSSDEYKDHLNVFPDRIQRLTEFIHNVSHLKYPN